MIFKKDKSVAMSRPELRKLHGVEIKKPPVGKYVWMLQQSKDILPEILVTLFPEMQDGKISTNFANLTAEGLQQVLARAAAVIPGKLCGLVGELLDIPEEMLLGTEDGLTPVELMEILIVLWEVNNLSDFFPLVRKLKAIVGLSAQNTGSSAG